MSVLHPVVKKVLGYLVYVFYIVYCLFLVQHFIDNIFSPFFTYFISRYPLSSPFLHFVNMQCSRVIVCFLKGTPFNLFIGFFMICLFINNNEPFFLSCKRIALSESLLNNTFFLQSFNAFFSSSDEFDGILFLLVS